VTQRVVYTAQLEAQLLLIAYVPGIAAAAGAEIRAHRLQPGRGGLAEHGAQSVNCGGADLEYLHIPYLAGYGTWDKNSPAADMAYSGPVGRPSVYDGGIYLIFL
jgi:hypothetical protein